MYLINITLGRVGTINCVKGVNPTSCLLSSLSVSWKFYFHLFGQLVRFADDLLLLFDFLRGEWTDKSVRATACPDIPATDDNFNVFIRSFVHVLLAPVPLSPESHKEKKRERPETMDKGQKLAELPPIEEVTWKTGLPHLLHHVHMTVSFLLLFVAYR